MGKERERNRVKSRIDELPEELVDLINKKLSDVSYTYQEIAEEITSKGYEISKSSIGRYALRKNKAALRLKEACETTKVLVETMKQNNDLEASEAASMILVNQLTQRIASAQEEFDNMPLDKAGRLIVQLQRSTVFKEKFKLEYKKGIKDAADQIKTELKKELNMQPELLERINQVVNGVTSKLESEQNE